MQRSSTVPSTLIALALASGAAAPLPATEDVFVVNFPEVQRIEGTVALEAPPPQGRLVRLERTIVASVGPAETTALVEGGLLETDGFVSVVLSLTGQVRADRYRAGGVGAILIPDEEPMIQAFHEDGQVLFPLRVEAASSPAAGPWFGSPQQPYPLGFPRYRVYYYNTTDRPAVVTLFAYLTN